MSTVEAPTAILRHTEELPFVDLGDGSTLQLLQVDLDQGLWVIRTKFSPGMTVQTHKHTGAVYAFTMSGSWKYLEYPDDVNVAGSYLFEPAGSIHTLHVPEDNTELTDVFFAIHGANLNLDEAGNVTSVIDAGGIRDFYLAMCEAEGLGRPPVIGG
jgi:quercetin dioxygenase-like cupin family protein